MHRRILLGRTHRHHHAEPDDDTFFKQFAYYLLGCLPPWAIFLALGYWLELLPLGIGLCLGTLVWSIWVAYAHVLMHVRPEMVFWMRRPVHYLHHHYEMGQHNFGLSVDWWDRILGTYKPMPWEPETPRRWRNLFAIPWFRPRVSPPS
jgi:sterol desaturase/sphingolipid hydroxylase (fatty acid hydroxylase superfamily)